MVDETLPHERRDFYVYVIFRPDGSPVYVGKGQRDRWRQHLRRSHNKRLRHLFALHGVTMPIVKIREGVTDAEACIIERALIIALGRSDLGKGPLVNFTDGGEGMSGYTPPAEHRDKIRTALAGRKRPESVVEALRRAARNRTHDWKAKQRAGKLGKKLSEERKAAIHAGWVKKYPGLDERQARVPMTKEETVAALRARSFGNTYGLGNKKSDETQARCNEGVRRANRSRNKSGKPTVHNGPQPWVNDGLSRTEWYRRRAKAAATMQSSLEL